MQNFSAKRNALFACLDDASKELKGTGLDQSETNKQMKALEDGNMIYRRGNKRVAIQDHSLSRMRGKESIFKKPELPIGRCLKPRKMPDYQINPHKWKKYSLSDVDISDHTNTAAAFAFLKEIDEQRELASTEPESMGSQKIEFKKSSKIKRSIKAIEAQEVLDAEVDKPKHKGSKLVMPEYVVGQKMEKKKNVNKMSAGEVVQRAAGTLTLSHLQEVYDDEEAFEEG